MKQIIKVTMPIQNEYLFGIWTWKRIAILEAVTLGAILVVTLLNI